MKIRLIKIAVLAAVGAAIFLCAALIRGLFGMTEYRDIMRGLCDGFSVAGLILLLVGLIVVCSNGGAYDIMGFATKKFFSVFRRAEKRSRETYAEYRERKGANKRTFVEFFIVGGVYFAAGMAFLIAYYA